MRKNVTGTGTAAGLLTLCPASRRRRAAGWTQGLGRGASRDQRLLRRRGQPEPHEGV